MPQATASLTTTWSAIGVVVVTSTVGDVLTAKAMKDVGDLGDVWDKEGFLACVKRVTTNKWFLLGVSAMALAFFSLLFALSLADVSLVAPAAASLSFVTNAIAAKFYLHEAVDARRWAAAVCVCGGVALLAA
ncbi:MAG: EamA family transporter [Candidatus Koribacter versatilis]|uniref:EamA family transporter n=1 Tax=Candidatus Korobacter versatilis TaxID=658062 RepID=A0A932AA44_9BACT|nr:EamA family transporter [Candidatus Koribacter versatilis]